MNPKLNLRINYKNNEIDSAYVDGTIKYVDEGNTGYVKFANKIANLILMPVMDCDEFDGIDMNDCGCLEFSDDDNTLMFYFKISNPTEWFKIELYDDMSYPLITYDTDVSSLINIIINHN
jgi:hypothetical protein